MENNFPTIQTKGVNKRAPLLDHVTELLSGVTLRRNVVAESLTRVERDLAPGFEYFRFARLHENALSSVFADMLRPNGSHGQGESFLRFFLETIGLEDQCLSNPIVETEYQANGQRRIDILLQFNDLILAIENKPWASDQDDQLRDYSEFIRSKTFPKGRSWKILYISNRVPDERSLSASDRSDMIKKGHLIEIDFQKIVTWIESCAQVTRALRVRVFLEELAQYIRREINGEPQMNEAEEIKKIILGSPDNIKSTIALNQVIRSARIDLLRRLHDGIKGEIRRHEIPMDLVWEEVDLEAFKRHSGFGLKRYVDQDIYLRFEFDGVNSNGFFWGIRRSSESVVDDEIRWQRILEVMKSNIGGAKQSPWWPWYTEWPDAPFGFDEEHRNWEWSAKPWVEIDNGNLAKRIVHGAKEIYGWFASVDKLDLLRPSWKGIVR